MVKQSGCVPRPIPRGRQVRISRQVFWLKGHYLLHLPISAACHVGGKELSRNNLLVSYFGSVPKYMAGCGNSGICRTLSYYSDGLAQDLHLFPFSPEPHHKMHRAPGFHRYAVVGLAKWIADSFAIWIITKCYSDVKVKTILIGSWCLVHRITNKMYSLIILYPYIHPLRLMKI